MRPITRVEPKHGYKVLIPGDVHGGIQDDDVLELLVKLGKKEQVDTLVLLGDNHDCSGVSPHRTDVEKFICTLEDEDDAIAWFTAEFEDVIALAGNHERWVIEFLAKNPGLGKGLRWNSLFPKTYKKARCLPYEGILKIGALNFEHGHELRGSLSMYSAKNVWNNYPSQNTIYGHTHRQDSWLMPTMKDGKTVLHGAWTIGHCSRPEEHRSYAATILDRWIQGGALVEWYKAPDGKFIHKVSMLTVFRDGRGKPYICYNGNVYK